MYVIQTSHKDKDDTLTKPLEFEEACDLYESMTGADVRDLEEGEEATDGIITLREASLPELVFEEDGLLMVDNIIDTFSQDRIDIAWKRTAREFGGLEADPDSLDTEFGENYVEEFQRQLKLMATSDLMDYFKDRGIIRDAGVNEDGEIEIEVTETGHALLE